MTSQALQTANGHLAGELSNVERDILHDVGFDSEESRAGTCVLTDHEVGSRSPTIPASKSCRSRRRLPPTISCRT